MSKRIIYLDNAATTRPYVEAVGAANTYVLDNYANPGGNYDPGYEAKLAVNNARKVIAKTLGATPGEIYFTSGGSESDNMAIRGIASTPLANKHIITTAVEHKAVLNTCRYLEGLGCKVTYLDPDERGIITPEQVKRAITPETILVSIMAVNNEIGTVMPIKEIGAICHANHIIFHTDAVQAYSHMKIDVGEYNIDILSASGHKFHAMKGTGFLFVRDGIILPPLIYGGGQENHRRAGTENVPAIVSMGIAARMAHDNLEMKQNNILSLRDHMIERVLNEIPGSNLNGSLVARTPNNVNVRFEGGIRGESLLTLLNEHGVYCSTGSACNSEEDAPSHVLKAIGLTDEEANSSIRFTLSEFTTLEDIDLAVNALKMCVDQLRFINRN